MTVAALVIAIVALLFSLAALWLVAAFVDANRPDDPDDPDDWPGGGDDRGPGPEPDPEIDLHPMLDVHPGPPVNLGRATRRTLKLAGHTG